MTRSADTKEGGEELVHKRLSDVPADLLASRLTSTLIMAKGNLNQYDQDLKHFIERMRAEAAEDRAELLEAAREMSAVLSRFGDWEDGCFYYNSKSATELEAPQQRLADALAKALTPTEEGR